MKKLFVLILALIMLSGCSKGYSKFFPEPVDFEYLNGGKELSKFEFHVNKDKEVFKYEPIKVSVSETLSLKEILKDYKFEYVVPGENDGKNGRSKYGFRSTFTDNPVSGTEVFYLGFDENMVSAGVTEIGVYEYAVYLFIDIEPCENPEDFSAEEFDFGPNFLYFACYDEELVARMTELCENIEKRVPTSVELSEEDFYSYAKKTLGYTDEQLDMAILSGLPKTLILRPESHGACTNWRVSGNRKYEMGLFWWGSEFKIPYNDGTKDYYFESTLFLPYLKDLENGTFRFIPEFEYDNDEYNYSVLGEESVYFWNDEGIRVYNLSDVSEPSAEIKTKTEKGERKVLSTFDYGENLYVFKILRNNVDSFWYYESPLDYTSFYEIDVIDKDGSFLKTINTYVPWKQAYSGGGTFVPEIVETSVSEKDIIKIYIHGNGYKFDPKTETMTQILPKEVEIFYEKDENGKFALTKNGKPITEYVYDSISIEKIETYSDGELRQRKDVYYAVCVFVDGTENFLTHTEEYPGEPYFEEKPNAKADIYFSDGTLFNEKPLQSFDFYTLIPNFEYFGGFTTEKFTYRLSGYGDGVYYEYERFEGEEIFVTTKTPENSVNEFGFTVTECFHPFFGERYGINDTDGNIILEPVYLRVTMPFKDRILVNVGRYYDYVEGELGRQFIIDPSGNMVCDEYDRINFYFDKDGSYIGIAYSDQRNMSYGSIRYWFIDKDGNKISEIEKPDDLYVHFRVDFESGKITGIINSENVCEYKIEDYIQKP